MHGGAGASCARVASAALRAEDALLAFRAEAERSTVVTPELAFRPAQTTGTSRCKRVKL
jgi:hypothetical protein